MKSTHKVVNGLPIDTEATGVVRHQTFSLSSTNYSVESKIDQHNDSGISRYWLHLCHKDWSCRFCRTYIPCTLCGVIFTWTLVFKPMIMLTSCI